MSKDYDEPIDLLALAAGDLLEAHELDAASAAREGQPELAGALQQAWEALDDVPPPPAHPKGGWERLSAALDAQPAALAPDDSPGVSITVCCVYCHDDLTRSETRYCASCLAPHHGECFAGHGHCAAPGCVEVHTVRAQLEQPVASEVRPRSRLQLALVGAAFLGLSAAALVPWVVRPVAQVQEPDPAAGGSAAVVPSAGFDAEPTESRDLRAPEVSAPNTPARAEAFQRALELGHRAEVEGRLGDAHEHYSDAIKYEAENPQGYVARVRVLFAQGLRGDARRDLSAMLGRVDTNSYLARWARYTIGGLSIEELDYEDASLVLTGWTESLPEPEGEFAGEGMRGLWHKVRQRLLELSFLWADSHEATLGRGGASVFDHAKGKLQEVVADSAELDGEVAVQRWRSALSFALRVGLHEEARSLAKRGLRAGLQGAERAFAHAALGVALTLAPDDRDDRAVALRNFEAALRLQPDSMFALAAAGLAEPQGAKRSWRVELAARARHLATSGSSEASRAYREGLRWSELAGKGRQRTSYERARRAFVRALQLHPLHADSLIARSRLYAAWGEPEAALAAVGHALRVDPRSVRGHVVQGELYLARWPADPLGLRMARTTFNHAVELAGPPESGGSDSVEAHFGRARVALAEAAALAGDSEQTKVADLVASAREDLTLALEGTADRYPDGRPRDVRLAIRLLEALRDLSRTHGPAFEAEDCADRLAETLAAARAAADELRKQSRLLRDQMSYSEAIAILNVAQELDPEYGQVYFERGTNSMKIGNFVPAILDLSRALELDPRIGEEVYSKVYQMTYVVDLERIMSELHKIVADHPEEAHVVFLRGFFYVAKAEFKDFSEEDLQRGIADFDHCLSLNPKHVTALLYRGFLNYKRAEDRARSTPEERRAHYAEALADYDRALVLDPGSSLSRYLQGIVWAHRMGEPGASPEEFERWRAKALEQLERAVDGGFAGGDRLKNEPAFDALRETPQFAALLERLRTGR